MRDGWKKKTVGHLFDVQLGKMLNEKAKTGPQFPYLANFNVRWGNFDFSKLNKMTFSAREKDKYRLYKDDLLMCEGGEIGRCAIWQGFDSEIYYQKALHRVRPKSKEGYTGFLYFYMQYIASQGKLTRLVGETSIAHLTREKLIELPLLFPPLLEQKSIVNLLSTWDEAIEKTERLVREKEKRFKWVINSLINATKGCEEIRLGNICTVTKGKQLNMAHMKDDGVYYALNGGIEPSGRTNDWNTEAETITISEGGNSCGYVNYNSERFWSGGHCYSLLRLKKNVDKCYIYFYLKMNEPKIMKLRVGSGLPNIQKKDINKFIVALPSLDEQQQIAQLLSSVRQEIDLLRQLADKYKTQKRGLMQKMLTGEWRVKPESGKIFEEINL
jgi:type I restriction enzyme S subunit